MTSHLLPRITSLPARATFAVDDLTLREAATIVGEVERDGEPALRRYAQRFGDLAEGGKLFLSRDALAQAAEQLTGEDLRLLERTRDSIRHFALQQRECLQPLDIAIGGGRAGHTLAPVKRAGCYAPGGRFPLPSSVLMTAVTARTAGVEEVWVASPKPSLHTLAAAYLAGADGLLAAGGAHAISALAFGCDPLPPSDIVVGPGNRWVTAAKQLVSGRVGIDMLAGPSELLVVADSSANPVLVAADLLAQAEHDVDARPMLLALDASLLDRVEAELQRQLALLAEPSVAREALNHGFALLVDDRRQAARLCDQIAPEHLEVMLEEADTFAAQLNNYGALFLGAVSAEVFGDYGVGPNHVLPTGGTARYAAGLSVFTFLRIRTWLRLEAAMPETIADASRLARIEGLEAHARAAEARKTKEH